MIIKPCIIAIFIHISAKSTDPCSQYSRTMGMTNLMLVGIALMRWLAVKRVGEMCTYILRYQCHIKAFIQRFFSYIHVKSHAHVFGL